MNSQKMLYKILAFAWLAVFAASANAVSFTDVIVFGDSLSDTGNRFAQNGDPTEPEYFMGRFSNGPVWVETLASNLGLSVDAATDGFDGMMGGFDGTSGNPIFTGGTNYAFGGARTGALTTGAPSLIDQKNFYLDNVGGSADPNALYVIFGGGNDILDVVNISTTAPNMASVITDLAGAGATNFLWANVPNVGLTPTAIENGIEGLALNLTNFVNGGISTEIANLNSALPGINIIELDVFGFLNSVVANPGMFGLTDLTNRCLDESTDPNTVCANPDEFLFWDGIHPTAAAAAALGEFAFATVVPVPPAVILFGSALAMLGWFRKRLAT